MNKARLAWILLVVACCAAAAVAVFGLSFSYFNGVELRRAQNRASLYHSALISALEQFRHLPYIVARDPLVIAGASGGDLDRVNTRLEEFARQAGLNALYLMDLTGLTIASSNHRETTTFLGQNYGFRPYFRQARGGARGEFFGVGATTSQPGYFIAELVRGSDRSPRGVVALKIDLKDLTRVWIDGGEDVLVSNSDGVVLLASQPQWLYRTLAPVSEERRRQIAAERQFGGAPLLPLDWTENGNDRATIDGRTYLHVTAPVSMPRWQLHFLADDSPVWLRSIASVIGASIVASLFFAVALFIRSERLHAALRASQQDRRELRASNVKLEQEIEERRAAEERLEQTRSELARANKLAVLGQLAASVTHELGQPISAMRNYLSAAEYDADKSDWSRTLERLDAIAQRMEHIVKQLRFFARPGDDRLEVVDLRTVISGAKVVMEPALQAAAIRLSVSRPPFPVLVKADRMRLEQVLVNLVRNSIAALSTRDDGEVGIRIALEGQKAILSVEDNGPGIGDSTVDQLQEPFQTTRPSGEGMGLGLAISAAIAREHHGAITAANGVRGGAVFGIELPLADEIVTA